MFEVIYKVQLENDTRPDYADAGATNQFDDSHSCCRIIHYLENFHYRKNVNHKIVANDCNKYFFVELLCGNLREGKSEEYTPCKDYTEKCPPEIVFEHCRDLLAMRCRK